MARAVEECERDEARSEVFFTTRHGVAYEMRYCLGQDVSLQNKMLREGGAVLCMPEMGAYPAEWSKVQSEAKSKKRGVWKKLIALKADTLEGASEFPEWAWVRGNVHSVTKRDFGTYINFSNNWKEDFSLFIHKTHRPAFGKAWWNEIVGLQIEVMGYLYHSYGPMMDITHPSQVIMVE